MRVERQRVERDEAEKNDFDAVRLVGVKRRFGDGADCTLALRGVSFGIERGEVGRVDGWLCAAEAASASVLWLAGPERRRQGAAALGIARGSQLGARSDDAAWRSVGLD